MLESRLCTTAYGLFYLTDNDNINLTSTSTAIAEPTSLLRALRRGAASCRPSFRGRSGHQRGSIDGGETRGETQFVEHEVRETFMADCQHGTVQTL